MHLFKNALDSLPSIDYFPGWHLLQKFRIPPPHCFLFVQHHQTASLVREPSAVSERSTLLVGRIPLSLISEDTTN